MGLGAPLPVPPQPPGRSLLRQPLSPLCPGAGVGVGMLLVSSLVSLYYNVIIAWTFYYLGSSFQSPLPWSCDAPQNAELCQVGVPGLGLRGQTLQGARGGLPGAKLCLQQERRGRMVRLGLGLGREGGGEGDGDGDGDLALMQNPSGSATHTSASEAFWK